MHSFWTNTIWYLLLGIAAVVELSYVLYKSGERRLMLGLFLSFSGIAYMIEILIFGIFKGYDYYPMILNKVSKIDDSIVGNMFSQFSIAATALLVSSLNLKKYWYLLCALAYGGIEVLFLYLGIYGHYWYRTWMTVIGLFILFWAFNVIYRKAAGDIRRAMKYALVILAVYVLHVHMISFPVTWLIGPAFDKGILPDEFHSLLLTRLISFSLLALAILAAYYKKLRLRYHAVLAASFCAAYYLLYDLRLIIYTNIALLLVFAATQIAGMYLCVYIVDRLYARGSEPLAR